MQYNTTFDGGIYRWPDSYLGSEEYYSIDCGPYLEKENDTLVSVEWLIPPELSSTDNFILNNEAFILLSADTIGSHVLKFKLFSTESGKDQKAQERVKLNVLNF